MAALYAVPNPGIALILGVLLLSAAAIIGYIKSTKKQHGKPLPSFSEKPVASKSQEISYQKVFPPSQRQQLSQLGPKFAGAKDIDLSTLPTSRIVKLNDDVSKCSDSLYNFSGFSVKDIRLLGRFPDYATLSGVPLPSPLPNFDITKAKPRPYRPFRWPYHQTMCKT